MDEFTVQVCNLPPAATHDDVKQFFSYCGTVRKVKLEKAGPWAKVAFVTFKEAYAVDTAVLLSGSTIAKQQVCILPWGGSEEAIKRWKMTTLQAGSSHQQRTSTSPEKGSYIPSPGQAVAAVTAMLSKGYVLGKDAVKKAQELDKHYQVTSTAAAKVSSASNSLGITDKINSGATAVRSVDSKYGVSDKGKFIGEKSKAALLAAGQAVGTAGSAVVNSSYFASGALMLSNALDKAAKHAADLGTRSKQ